MGRIFGFLGAWYLQAPQEVKTLFMVYHVAGVLLWATNFIIGKKASGHACRVSDPIALLTFIFGEKALLAFLLMPLIFWSRLQRKRHNISDLFFGTIIGISVTVISIFYEV